MESRRSYGEQRKMLLYRGLYRRVQSEAGVFSCLKGLLLPFQETVVNAVVENLVCEKKKEIRSLKNTSMNVERGVV